MKLLRFAKMLSVVMIFALLAAPANAAATPNGGKATNIRMNGRIADFYLDDGEQYAALIVTRDEMANTTSPSVSHSVLHYTPASQNLPAALSRPLGPSDAVLARLDPALATPSS